VAFVKIHATILDSSVWAEPHATRIVWITMLAMADEHGVVQASVSGLARRAAVSREECEIALHTFLGPDEDTRDGTAGQRIEKVPGGWLILNHSEYRERRTHAQIKTAARVAKHRDKKRQEREGCVTGNDVTPGNGISPPEAEAEAEAEADQEHNSSPPRSAVRTVRERNMTAAIAHEQSPPRALDAPAEGATNGAKPTAADSRKRRAREVHDEYERLRVATLHGNRGKARGFTDDDHNAMVRLMRHIAKVEQCDEDAAWAAVAEYGRLAIGEAHASVERGDDDAEKLITWRRGPAAWRKTRYEAVMAKTQAKTATHTNGTKRVKHDDELDYFYYLDKWKQRVKCDEEGNRL